MNHGHKLFQGVNDARPRAAGQVGVDSVDAPFAAGSLFRTVSSHPLPAWAAEINCASWAQLFLKFVISHPAVTCAIPATSKVQHLRDNMQAGFGRLPDAKMRELIARSVANI